MKKNDIVFLIQTNGIDYRHVSKIWDAATKYASVEEAIVVPFKETLDNDFSPKGQYVVVYGSVRLSRIALMNGWDGVYVNDNFDNSKWVKNRNDMLNQDMEVCSIKELSNHLDKRLFLRPEKDNKSFRAGIYERQDMLDLISAAEMGDNHGYGTSSEVVMASPKDLTVEERYFVVGGEVVTGSIYAQYGVPLAQPITSDIKIKNAQTMADVWLPHETCVMDLMDTNEGYKVIEFNAFNSSGFYEHDIDAIVKKTVDWIIKRNM